MLPNKKQIEMEQVLEEPFVSNFLLY